MKCINISHPDFKSLLSQSNKSSFDLELSVSKWQQDNNTESFPTLAQLEIKPGVEELFNNNPEFSSQIYEAAGFTEIKSLNELKPLTKELLDYYKINPNLNIDNIQNINNILTSISKNSPWKHFRNLASIYLNYTKEIPYRLEFKNLTEGNGIYLKQFRLIEIENKLLQINNDLDRFNYEMVILHEMTHGLTLYGYNTNKEFKNKVDKLFDFAKLNATNKTLYGLTSPEEFLAEILVNPDFQKEMNNISYDKKNTVLTFFNSLIKELLNSMGIKFNENSVLSEAVDLSLSIIPLTKENLKSYKDIDFFSDTIINKQKQQALQLYSQYLDTIFPDSKVKDIVYHGTTKDFENFDKSFIRKSNINAGVSGSGFYFTPNKEFAKAVMRLIYGTSTPKFKTALINISNSYTHSSEQKQELGYSEFKDISDITNSGSLKETTAFTENVINKGFDSIIETYNNKESVDREIVVFEPEQIHILGSKQDIENFSNFVKNSKVGNTENMQNYMNSKSVDYIMEKLIQSGKIEKRC